MKSSTNFTIAFNDEKEAMAACKALEGESFKGDRAISHVSQEGSKVLINIEANDIVALRATVNSYLRHVQIMQNINEVDENGE